MPSLSMFQIALDQVPQTYGFSNILRIHRLTKFWIGIEHDFLSPF